MEIAIILILIVFLIIMLKTFSNNSASVEKLRKEISYLRKELNQLDDRIGSNQSVTVKPSAPSIEKIEEAKTIAPPIEKIIPPQKKEEEIVKEVPPVPAYKTLDIPTLEQTSISQPENDTAIKPPVSSEGSWFDRWLRDNPDIEKFIGENLINKIGIAVLVLGIAFFVKYAIDQDWINKVGRVCIGLFCGLVLIGLAHRLRKNYHSFSSVLVGGGLTVFYFTIAFAYHQYQLIGQMPAFAIMIVITIFAVILSVLYDRIELGIIATIGGFITPFLVSNGEGNYVALFSYVSILNAGLIFLAYCKRWRVLNFIAFFFTQIIYIGWIIEKIDDKNFPFQNTFIFGSIFYLMFVIMNVIHHVIRNSKLKAFDFIILLSVNLFFYGSGLYLLNGWGKEMYNGLFTASLGIINLVLAYIFFKKSKADKNFIYLLIAITLTFISLTAPVQLKGNYITLFWSAEIVVLLWLYQKSFIKLFKLAFVLVSALMIVSLIWDWIDIYGATKSDLQIIINKGFGTGIFSSISMLVCYYLLKKEGDTYFFQDLTNELVRRIYFSISMLLFFSTGALEIYHQFNQRFPTSGFDYLYLSLYVTAFVFTLFLVLRRLKRQPAHSVFLLLPLLTFAIYLLNLTNAYDTEIQLLTANSNKGYFMANWINVLLLLLLAWYVIQYLRKNKEAMQHALAICAWMLSAAIIMIISFEFMHLFVWINFTDAKSIPKSETMYAKAGLTIVWGISSFAIMWLGMQKRYKPLRIIALVMFGITLIKLFAFDISDISPAGKIIAFILLGVLLLIISFMYQRLKKIIIDDVKNP